MVKIAVIGAGLSGLTIAHYLREHADVVVFEKARGVGGRMSTRRADSFTFDHGAQYFTARTKAFQTFLRPALEMGIVQRWDARYVKFKNTQIIEQYDWSQGEPRYVAVPGMNALAKHLASDLNTHVSSRICELHFDQTWALESESGQCYAGFDWVISTAPSPQTMRLFPKQFAHYNQLSKVQMTPCIALMLGFESALKLDFQAAHVTDSIISWIAINSHKPGRPNPFTLLVHSSEEFAANFIDRPSDEVLPLMTAEVSRLLDQDISSAPHKTLHPWRYANNKTASGLPHLIDPIHQLIACGDWCHGGRVEGAFTAALDVVQKLKRSLDE